MNSNESFKKARRLAKSLKKSLPKKIDAANSTLKSKLPFKALSVRETLIHRVSGIATPAIHLFEQSNTVAGIILTRAIVESVAVIFALQREIDSFLLSGKIDALDEFLMSCLVGSRWPDSTTQSRNVLTLIDHVDKKFEGYRSTYDTLCEYTHPNWSGVLGSFGAIDHKSHVLHLGQNDRASSFTIGVTALAMSLGLFEYAYNETLNSLKELNEYFENSANEA